MKLSIARHAGKSAAVFYFVSVSNMFQYPGVALKKKTRKPHQKPTNFWAFLGFIIIYNKISPISTVIR